MRRIRAEQAFAHQPRKETPQDCEPLSSRCGRAGLPVPVQEPPRHSPTLRRLEVVQRQVGVLDREKPEHVLVRQERVEARVRVFEPIEIGDDVFAQWRLSEAAVGQCLAHYPRRQRERQGVRGGGSRKLRHFAFPWPLRAARRARTLRRKLSDVGASEMRGRRTFTLPPAAAERGF